MTADQPRTAVLQMELDLNRWANTKAFNKSGYDDTPWGRLYGIVKTAACDTLNNGGTFVLVRSGNLVTIVQRQDEDEPKDHP